MLDLFSNIKHLCPKFESENIHMSLRMFTISLVDLSRKDSTCWERQIVPGSVTYHTQAKHHALYMQVL